LSAAVRSAEKDKEEEREGKVWRHFCKENIFSSTNHLLILFHFFSKPVEYWRVNPIFTKISIKTRISRNGSDLNASTLWLEDATANGKNERGPIRYYNPNNEWHALILGQNGDYSRLHVKFDCLKNQRKRDTR
jgi:hypothetical protein